MEYITTQYDKDELAWVSPIVELRSDIYLMIELLTPGKIVIRQNNGDGKWPRMPIRRHKDERKFELRMSVLPKSLKIQIYTSTNPKEIKYAYI